MHFTLRKPRLRRTAAFGAGCLVLLHGHCLAATFTDDFSSDLDYLVNGVAGAIWDGVYFGAGEFQNTGVGGGGPGATLVCDANITAPNTLTIESTGTAWEHADDDGFFLFKIAPGDFSVQVRVVSPFDNSSYNTAGLMARVFDPGGDPFGGSEDYVSWTRFNQFGYANYLRNEVNGTAQQINPGGFPNNNYWLRMDRVNGTNFLFYQKATSGGPWQLVSFPAPVSGTVLRRADFAGLPMQVGIIHATFAGQLGVQFTDFSLTLSNAGPYAPTPGPATSLILAPGPNRTLSIAWAGGAGSSGSTVVMWAGTNSLLKHIPVNGTTYAANASYGAGARLPGAGHYVVYSGAGNSVTVSNLALNVRYNVAVFTHAGSGDSISYNRTPPVAGITLPPNEVIGQASVDSSDVVVVFTANPGKWYQLQATDTLNPPAWYDIGAEPVLANSEGMVLVHINGALAIQRFYRLRQMDPLSAVNIDAGAITSLKNSEDVFETEHIAGGRRLGDANLRYRQTGTNWLSARTVTMTGIASVTYSTNAAGTEYKASYRINNGLSGNLIFESAFIFHRDFFEWEVGVSNLTGGNVELGDLALPLPMNTAFSSPSSSVFKHSFVSGHGSFIFWMRPNSVGPYLLMTPTGDTWLEYWDRLNGGYEVYIHSKAEGAVAAAQGTQWRQPNTSLLLGPGESQRYGFKFQWADGYDGVRQALVNEGKLDVHVVPGMTVPTNLFARVALRTTQTINSITAEFPDETQIQSLGNRGDYAIYEVRFSRLGENLLTVNYGDNHKTCLEFFVTEPIETLIRKRSAFIANHQVVDPTKWYDGLLCEWNMSSGVLLTPDNYDLISGFRIYAVTCDDPGLSHPAYLASKQALYPVQSEVNAMDYYLENFVWGGLQRTTNETFAYGVYGIPDWFQNRNSSNPGSGGQLHLWRIYDYPHVVVMYLNMYRVAKNYPHISTALTANEYLRRAYGTAVALYTIPLAIAGWSAYETGLMNERVVVELIAELEANGWTAEASTLRNHWEQKVDHFVNQNPDLYGSEYAFDSTGFETTHEIAKYATQYARTNAGISMSNALLFLEQQMAANLVVRGWLEPAYYYLGSDYRATAGDEYVLTYMSQMGGWSVLDYAMNYAADTSPYLRLGYASCLSAWALMNTGTPDSNYGYWYPGAGNDGGCGGGFEPAPYGTTWLGQPHHRGSWYYASETDLGYCGALRTAATVLADDSIFGRFCYGGLLQQTGNTNWITPLDGVRRRFYAALDSGKAQVVLENDRFANSQSIAVTDDLSRFDFLIETDNPAGHAARLRFKSSIGGTYTVSDTGGVIAVLNLASDEETGVDLPIEPATATRAFSIAR